MIKQGNELTTDIRGHNLNKFFFNNSIDDFSLWKSTLSYTCLILSFFKKKNTNVALLVPYSLSFHAFQQTLQAHLV